MYGKSQDGSYSALLLEERERLDSALARLRAADSWAWLAFRLRVVRALPRKVVAEFLGTQRLADVNELVLGARLLLIKELPPRSDLV